LHHGRDFLLGKFNIHLIEVGKIARKAVEETVMHLNSVFPGTYATTSTGNPEILREAYDSTRKQHHSSTLLMKVGDASKSFADRILVIVDVDLYVPRLNFIFGEAQCPGRMAIISTYRLKLKLHGESYNSVFVRRIKKEATHELGHTLGIAHCANPICVMRFSNNIDMTDRKNSTFCPSCEKRVYRKLREFMSKKNGRPSTK